jgi:VanZ family protein
MACVVFIIWIGVIFVLSTEYFSSARTAPAVAQFLFDCFPALSEINPTVIEVLTRKLAHWTEYFVLAVFCMGALTSSSVERTARCHIIWGLILGLICAVVDEFHQSFVPSRTASTRDVLINAIGFVCGTFSLYTFLAIKRVKRAWARTRHCELILGLHSAQR